MDLRTAVPLAVALQIQAENLDNLGNVALQMSAKLNKIRRRRRRKPRKYWTGPCLVPRLRHEVSQFYIHLQILRHEQPKEFKRELRMRPEVFDKILEKITPDIMGPGNNYRPSLPPGLKLAVVLKYLAHGCEQIDLWTDFVVSKAAICNMIEPVCNAIQRHFTDDYFKTPTTEQEWLQVAQEFEDRWQLPHCLGALDGKHCRIKCPKHSGSLYWCVYKKVYSIVLMALVDARYRFIWVDVGGLGHQSDAQIYNESSLKECLDQGTLNIPPPAQLSKDRPTPASPKPGQPLQILDPADVPYYIIGE